MKHTVEYFSKLTNLEVFNRTAIFVKEWLVNYITISKAMKEYKGYVSDVEYHNSVTM